VLKTRSVSLASISVIIPVWRDSKALDAQLGILQSCAAVREIIVSAAQPTADLRARVEAFGAKFLECAQPNRGRQLNQGAKIATADWLLFHHADSHLDGNQVNTLAALSPSLAVGGAFYRKFDQRHPRLRCLEKFERWHSRAFGTLYGDQSIFVRRDHFLRMGGFAPFPIMEDVEFSRRLRRSGRIRLVDPPIRSCAQKQIEQGAWTTTLRNLLFLVLFRCGVRAERLHAWYYGLDRRSPLIDRPPLAPKGLVTP
jgi:rSAM/selenodomain-associated transferase 2